MRRDRRDFIREHHPGRGGDPDVFSAGLNSFRPEHDPHAERLAELRAMLDEFWGRRLARLHAELSASGEADGD